MTEIVRSTFDRATSGWFLPNEKLGGKTPITYLFNRLDGAYPIRWRSAFHDTNSIENWEESWAEAFDEEGITPRELKAGLQSCRHLYEWPPSLTEFIKACRPTLVPEVAFHEAVRGMIARNRGEIWEWSHPAIFWAAVKVSSHEILGQGYAMLRTRWENALRDVLAAGAWEAIPGINIALPAPIRSDADREEAARRMAQMGAAGVLNPRGRDHKAWAHKILAKLTGNHSVSPTVAAMARRALGMEES